MELYKTLNLDYPLSTQQLEDMYFVDNWALVSSLSYQEGTVWRFVYYFKNRNYGL